MKKSNIILVLILVWLSVFSFAISPGLAVEFKHVDQETVEVEGNFIKRVNVVGLYDHFITMEFNSTRNISMLFLKRSVADFQQKVFNHRSSSYVNITEKEKLSLDPIWNINSTDHLNKTSKWRVPDDEAYVIIFINNNLLDANLTFTITKDEIGTSSYIFGGIISVLFFGSIFIFMKNRKKLLSQ